MDHPVMVDRAPASIRSVVTSEPPLVTIAIPTHERPQLLSRALESVSHQSYPRLQVIVSDNASEGSASREVVEQFKSRIAGIDYVRHDRPVPILTNYLGLRDRARGQYFMWLADDDEISPDYVSELTAMLESEPSAACATGHWVLVSSDQTRRLMPTASYPQRNTLARVLRFIWHSDDAFFYGLHRTSTLREAGFRGYWWPNRATPRNWAFVFLLDVVLRGRVLLSDIPSVQFVNHNYTAKAYATRAKPFTRTLALLIRRINVHYLYWEKCARHFGPLVLPLIVLTSLLSLARESVSRINRRVVGKA